MKNSDSSSQHNDSSRRSNADVSSSQNSDSIRPESSPKKDSWAKIADEIDAAASNVHSDWNAMSSRSSSDNSTLNNYVFGESGASDGIEWDGGDAGSEVSRKVSGAHVERRNKIDEDYETRSKNRTSSVWNGGEWSSSEGYGGNVRKGSERYSQDRNTDFNDGYRRSGYRQDSRDSYRASGRSNYRGERSGYNQGGNDERRRAPNENSSYRTSGFNAPRRESGNRSDMRRDGGYRGDGYRNDSQRPNDRDRGYGGRYGEKRDSRRGSNDYQRRYSGEHENRPQDNDRRSSNRRNYRYNTQDQYSNDHYRNDYKGGYYGGDDRRRSRYGRRENLEPTIGALGKRGEPLSLAEEIAARRYKRPNIDKFNDNSSEKQAQNIGTEGADTLNAVPYGDHTPLEITNLEKMTTQELVAEARRQNLETIEGERRRDLVVRVLRAKIQQSGMMFGEGTLEILPDEFGFLRSSKSRYISCPDDIYISPSQIRRFGLRNGLTISGQIRPPKERERYFALLRVESINGADPNLLASKPFFDDLVDARPTKQFKFETQNDKKDATKQTELPDVSESQLKRSAMNLRAIDLVAPLAFGQRSLLVYSDHSEKTALIREMVKSALNNNEEAFVFVLMIDQRPEEIAEMENSLSGIRCEVVGSAFDESPVRHIQISEIVFEKAKRMVEYGQDVVIVLDSLTRLARAWNTERASAEMAFTGSLDPIALQRPKKLFSSARWIDEGGSLTIVATANLEDDNSFAQAALEEFKGIGNAEIWLDQIPADSPAPISVNVVKSFARDIRDFITSEDYQLYCNLYERLKSMPQEEAVQLLGKLLEGTKDNAELLASFESEKE